MSWQAYIDDTLLKSGHLDKAAIIAGDGASTWATATGFQVSASEGQALSKVLGGDNATVFSDGFHVGGERYVATKAEDRSLYGRQGRSGVVVVKTKQAIIIGHYGPDHQAGNAANVVEKLADYLIGVGY
ncbi:hypothetical protein jhhlp_003569 [Lomentospora prolificans]|uniref:Profilin n=1 Tax=Lomentospora prolificans TaxID=41688 RepID=A0A2N3N939_9PEZI|nr:hypothetical protein jhhlp_003569 [Lomentospora prolificans]